MEPRAKKPIRQRYGKDRERKSGDSALGRKIAVLGTGFFFLAAGLVLGGFIIYKALGRSEFFQITATSITGCRRTSKSRILELSGVDVHSNLLALDTKKARGEIEAHDWVESAKITRDWPNKLRIAIKERTPVAIVSMADGLYYLDQNGVAFAGVLPPEDMDYPLITGLTRENWPKSIKDSQLGEALQLIRQAGQGNAILPRQNISELNLDGKGNLTMYLVDRPFPIHLGSGQMGTKYYWLTKVLHRLYKSKEFEETIFVKLDYGRNRVLVGFANAG